MSLDKKQISQINQLLKEPGYDALMLYLAEFTAQIQDEQITGSNAFEELRELHKKQGKLEGLTEFFESIEKKVFSMT